MKVTDLHEQPQEESWDKIIDIIVRDCSPFLKEARFQPMWRGVKDQGNYRITELNFPQNRENKSNLHPAFTETLSDIMEDEGFEAHRRNSIFCAGSDEIARDFGQPRLIFPIGNFHYTWHEWIVDYLDYIPIDRLQSHNIVPSEAEEYAEEFWAEAESGYRKDSLWQALKGKNEIMVTGSSYYMVNLKQFDTRKTTQEANEFMNSIMDKYNINEAKMELGYESQIFRRIN